MIYRLKILIIEDDILTAANLKSIVEEAGHQVTDLSHNFKDAMVSVKKHPPDIVLVDITLKDSTADGISTARALLEQRWMPVIYLTADAHPQTFHRAMETLPSAYLLKPFREEELLYQLQLTYHYFSQTRQDIYTGRYISEHIFIRIRDNYERIAKKDIVLLQANRAFATIHTLTTPPLTTSVNLAHLAQYLPDANFFRLSRSYLINLHHVESLNQSYVHLKEYKKAIAIPSGTKKDLMKILNVLQTGKQPSEAL